MSEALSIPLLKNGPFYRVPPVVQTTLAVKLAPDQPARKVTKIIGYRDGGFAMLAPYHAAKQGFITKMDVDYRQTGKQAVQMSTETFSASDRVKFSYHPDGFVQFSGENRASIVSGRDPVTGEPKGMGFMTNPLGSPVITGPSFGISFWGLDDFKEQKGFRHGDQIIFDESDVVYDHCDESNWGAYGISFFIFGLMFQPYVRTTGPRQYEMDLWLNRFLPDGAAFNLKVVRLGQQPYFLGAAFFRRPWHAGADAPPSGWIIGSPGARTRGPVKPVMHAHYPGNGIETGRSLDYGQWTPDRPGDSDDVDTAPEARFARDYRRLFQQAEAELLVRAPREVPVLNVVHEGTAVLAELMDGVWLQPIEQTGPAGAVRAATATLVVIVMRAARSFALLVGAGYAAEAASLAGRMQSAVSAARQIRDDDSGQVAIRLVSGATVRDLDPDLWEQSRQAMEAHLGQLPGLGPIVGPAGTRQPRHGIRRPARPTTRQPPRKRCTAGDRGAQFDRVPDPARRRSHHRDQTADRRIPELRRQLSLPADPGGPSHAG